MRFKKTMIYQKFFQEVAHSHSTGDNPHLVIDAEDKYKKLKKRSSPHKDSSNQQTSRKENSEPSPTAYGSITSPAFPASIM